MTIGHHSTSPSISLPRTVGRLTLSLFHDVDGAHEQLDADVAVVAPEQHGVAVAVLLDVHAAAAARHPDGVQLGDGVLAVLEAVPLVPHHRRDRAVLWGRTGWVLMGDVFVADARDDEM